MGGSSSIRLTTEDLTIGTLGANDAGVVEAEETAPGEPVADHAVDLEPDVFTAGIGPDEICPVDELGV